ncbi:MAG: tetratricopeptide repeat protein [Pyrinomonadaceae bacterium]
MAASTLLVSFAAAQTDESDPLKLFERGQNAHAQNNLADAVALYDQALELRPNSQKLSFKKAGARRARPHGRSGKIFPPRD